MNTIQDKIRKKQLTKKCAVLIILSSALLLILTIFLVSNGRGKITGRESAAAYLSALGWNVESQSGKVKITFLPQDFPTALVNYNKLQQEQGFDLAKHAGEEITIYSFPVNNYSNCNDHVEATLYVCKGQVIGGDIHSLSLDGFMHGIK